MSFSAKAGLAPEPPPTEWLTGPDGRLATSWYPAADPWLNVLVSHGFAEHRGWWDHVARALQSRGVNTLTYDQYAHGASDGTPGDVPGYGALTAGLRLALEQGLLPRGAGLPTAILAHSNGGLIALLALKDVAARVNALVLCSPLLGVPWQKLLPGWPIAKLLSLRDPAAFWPVKLRPWRLTHNEALWPEYGRDPLRFHRISARFFLAMVSESRRAAREVTCDGLPVLLLSAGEEAVVSLPAMVRWFDRLPNGGKRRIHYPHLRHELFNETHWMQVLEDVLAWLRDRFPGRGGRTG